MSIVDDFFSSKLAVVSMFENNDDLQAYFQAVSVPQDIEGYEDREKIQELLSMVLEKMGDEMVAEAWAADARTDRYLLSGGEVVEAGLKAVSYTHLDVYKRQAIYSQNTYRSPCQGNIHDPPGNQPCTYYLCIGKYMDRQGEAVWKQSVYK